MPDQLAPEHRSWAKPVCLECQTDVLVASSKSALYDYICYGCGRRFTAGDMGAE